MTTIRQLYDNLYDNLVDNLVDNSFRVGFH